MADDGREGEPVYFTSGVTSFRRAAASRIGEAVSWRLRLALSLLLGVIAACMRWLRAVPDAANNDFQSYWRATRLWFQGSDPYAMRPRAEYWRLWPLKDRLFYPLPTLVLMAPIALLPMRVAQAAFVSSAAGLLTWRLSRDALWPGRCLYSVRRASSSLCGLASGLPG
jgi:hypothetical protein